MGSIFEVIFEGVVEFLFGGILKKIFLDIRWLGLVVIKGISFSKDSLQALSEVRYKDASIPYFVGTGSLACLIYLMVKLFS